MVNSSAILNATILVVDDLEVNVKLLTQMLVAAGHTAVSSTMEPGEVSELHRKNRYDLILLDLQMPGTDGFAVMEELKKIEGDDYLPVLVITAQPDQKLRAFKAGAKDFISKPFEMAEVLARVQNMLEVRLLHKELHNANDVLEQRVRDRTDELREGYQETVFTMMRAAEYKDEDTGVHVKRISYYSRNFARILCQDEEFIDRIFFASPMHDIGKIGIPDNVLLKPSSLTPDEWKIMKGHTTMGARILGSSKSPYLKMGAEIALNHHERWDGEGYPQGLRGETIPMAARITNICDIYDALRSKRPYKAALEHVKVVEIITRGDGRTLPKHFSPVVLAAFEQNHQMFREIFETNVNPSEV